MKFTKGRGQGIKEVPLNKKLKVMKHLETTCSDFLYHLLENVWFNVFQAKKMYEFFVEDNDQ